MRSPPPLSSLTSTTTTATTSEIAASPRKTNNLLFLVKLYVILSIYRCGNALLIQTQFDPNEYRQTLEPAYCLVFSSEYTASESTKSTASALSASSPVSNPTTTVSSPIQSTTNCAYKWEWTRRHNHTLDDDANSSNWIERSLHGPVRSHLSILPTVLLYQLLKHFHVDTTWMVAKGPLLLNALLVAEWVTRYDTIPRQPQSISVVGILALVASVTNWFHGYLLLLWRRRTV